MKNNKYIFLVLTCCTLVVTSCMDHYESLPADEFTEDYLFSRTDSNGTQARQFLTPFMVFSRMVIIVSVVIILTLQQMMP